MAGLAGCPMRSPLARFEHNVIERLRISTETHSPLGTAP